MRVIYALMRGGFAVTAGASGAFDLSGMNRIRDVICALIFCVMLAGASVFGEEQPPVDAPPRILVPLYHAPSHVNSIFQFEYTMQDWSQPYADWYPPREKLTVDGMPVNLFWNRSIFPGDVEFILGNVQRKSGPYTIALAVAKDGAGRDNGYVLLRLNATDEVAQMQLLRQGKVVAEAPLADAAREFSSIGLRRFGKYVVATLDRAIVLSFRDESPLTGNKIAYYASENVTIRPEAVRVLCDNVFNDFFSSAPATWRTAGAAIAEVTNRWQDEPRWTFFSLRNDRKVGKPAVLWSKYKFPGDVSLRFFCSYKMDVERGTPYKYNRDINVTICSDGSDLNKGYTFMFGGFGNTGSMILRNGEVVTRIPAKIPTDMNYHRHWFHYKVEKEGGKLRFQVDRFLRTDAVTPELVYEDPQPLTGDRIAIWTYDSTFCISRVQIAGVASPEMESPDFSPAPLKTPLDKTNDER